MTAHDREADRRMQHGSEIVQGLQADGTVAAKSQKWLGHDYVKAPAACDIDAIEQEVK